MGNFAVDQFLAWVTVGLLVAAAASASATVPDNQKPRVASLNLCADTLLLQYADPDQIASVTWLSLDSNLSPYAQKSKSFHHNKGRAEDILRLKVDLVLTGASTSPTTVAMLKRLSLPTLRIEDANSIAEISSNVRRLTRAIHQLPRGEQSLQQMTRTLNAVKNNSRQTPRAHWPYAVFMQPNGLTVGPGSLSDELLSYAGFRNAANLHGLQTYQRFPLEGLLRSNPDLILVPKNQQQYPAQAQQLLEHPALSRVSHRHEIAPADLICGTTRVADVTAQIAAKRNQVTNL